jgi:hypothetical protein
MLGDPPFKDLGDRLTVAAAISRMRCDKAVCSGAWPGRYQFARPAHEVICSSESFDRFMSSLRWSRTSKRYLSPVPNGRRFRG